MIKLEDNCRRFHQKLLWVSYQCQEMTTIICAFDSLADSFARDRLFHKLKALGYWIITQANLLYEQYKYKGYVYVLLIENDVSNIYCAVNKQAVTYSSQCDLKGTTRVSVIEILHTVTKLAEDLERGEWVQAVDWLKKYGAFYGLDYENISDIEIDEMVRKNVL